jgi:hypothetical protein
VDLRKYNPTEYQVRKLKEVLSGYQPFIVSDTFQTGVGAQWARDYKECKLEKGMLTSKKKWRTFVSANKTLRKMYDDWIDWLCARAGNLKRLSAISVGCNDGYFLFRLCENGVREATGYDYVPERQKAIRLLNEVTGFRVAFRHRQYDTLVHGCGEPNRPTS